MGDPAADVETPSETTKPLPPRDSQRRRAHPDVPGGQFRPAARAKRNPAQPDPASDAPCSALNACCCMSLAFRHPIPGAIDLICQ